MKVAELKTKSKAELNAVLVSLLEEQFQLRMHKGVTESPKTHLFKEIRKNIARIKTVMRDL